MQLISQWSIDRYIRSCASRASLNVVWRDGQVPQCDGKTVYLPSIKLMTTDAEVNEIIHSATHEVGHVLHTDFNVLKGKKFDPESAFFFILNLIEDHRVNYLNAEAYEGDKSNDDEYYGRECPKTIAKVVDKGALELAQLLSWEASIHGDYAPTLGATKFKVLHPDTNDKLAKYSSVLRNIRTIEDPTLGTQASYDLAVQIAKDVFGEEPPPDEGGGDKEDEESEGDEGEGAPEGTESGDEDGEEDGEGEGGGSKGDKGEDGDGDDEVKAGKPIIVKYEELSKSDDSKKFSGTPVKIDYSTTKVGSEMTTIQRPVVSLR